MAPMRMSRFSRGSRRNRYFRAPGASLHSIHRSRLSYAFARKGSSPRRRLRAFCGDDRLSALSDDLLILILRRLDTRTALTTAALSKRWACLPRGLDTLDFRISDILPPRYHRCVRLHREAARDIYFSDAILKVMFANIKRYERHAMRAMAASINNFLDADNSFDSGGRDFRSLSTLRVEFFATQSSSCLNRLIAKALDVWGVNDLEVLANRKHRCHKEFHNFPQHGLCNDPHKSRLRTLKLGACSIPSLQGFHALTTLVLQDLPQSTPASAYEDVFTLCLQLQALYLKSCLGNQDDVVVDAPRSRIKQLVIEQCLGIDINLVTLPMLERMAVVDTRVIYKLSSFPHLVQLNMTKCYGIKHRHLSCFKFDWKLELFLGGDPGMINLVICFTGYDRCFKLWSPTLFLPKLRRVLIADVPSTGDVSCPRLLIKAAPCLESLHIHIIPWEEEPCDDISWQPPEFCHNKLKELVIVGFEGTKRQVSFVNFVIQASTALQCVSLYRKGRVQGRGHWEWDIVTEHYQWGNEEKAKILNQIADNVSCSATPIQLVLE